MLRVPLGITPVYIFGLSVHSTSFSSFSSNPLQTGYDLLSKMSQICTCDQIILFRKSETMMVTLLINCSKVLELLFFLLPPLLLASALLTCKGFAPFQQSFYFLFYRVPPRYDLRGLLGV